MTLDVLRAGPLTTVQDLGRPGWAHLGVPTSGALDGPALRAANRLAGNPPGTAGLEITLGGFAARAGRAVTVALTGAPAPLRVDGTAVEGATAVRIPAGARIDVGRPRHGLRCYLAVSGGIAVEPVLGSRSTDTLSGLGPPVVRDGVRLPLGDPEPAAPETGDPETGGPATGDPETGGPATGDPETRGPESGRPDGWTEITLRVTPGPRAGWFADPDALLGGVYQVDPRSNRVGVRLAGPPLARRVPGELPSEGLVTGAVQIPANGLPVIFLADHPTTGGYPVIAVVDEGDLPLLAQVRPGATVRFHGSQQ